MNIELWRQRKKELHLTHDQLAEKAGVSRRVIASIFAGDARGQNPTVATVEAIEKALGLANETPSVQEPPLTETQRRMLRAFDCLIPPMQDYVLEMVEKLIEQPQNARVSANIKYSRK